MSKDIEEAPTAVVIHTFGEYEVWLKDQFETGGVFYTQRAATFSMKVKALTYAEALNLPPIEKA